MTYLVKRASEAGRAEELFSKMDQNSDGLISQDEFISIMKQDETLLSLLQGQS